MSLGEHARRHLIKNLLPEELCQELLLIHRSCAVPGYRPGCTSTTLLANPVWALPALVRARDLVRDAVEEHFDAFGEVWPETTVTVAWLPSASLPVHTDDCQEHLCHRHISAVVWLSTHGQDFTGGEFFFDDGDCSNANNKAGDGMGLRLVKPRAGSAILFAANERHGIRSVTSGQRFALNVWFTRTAAAAEDDKLLTVLPRLIRLASGRERLHGEGPQAEWPPGPAAKSIARIFFVGVLHRHKCVSAKRLIRGRSHGLPSRTTRTSYKPSVLGQRLLKILSKHGETRRTSSPVAGAATVSPLQPALQPDERATLVIRASRKFLRAAAHGFNSNASLLSRFMAYLRQREQTVMDSLPEWQARGLLSSPSEEARKLQRKRSIPFPHKHKLAKFQLDTSAPEQILQIPGLAVARGCLGPRLQQHLVDAIDTLLLSSGDDLDQSNQAMRFGIDIPLWVHTVGHRCAQIDGLLSPGVANRRPLFDQLIVNAYGKDQGIKRHIDLLKFDDGVLGVCLGAGATLTMRRLRDGVVPYPGGECSFEDNDLTDEVVDVRVDAGDVYALCGDARYRWTHEIAPGSLRNGRRRVSLTLRRLRPGAWQGPCPSALDHGGCNTKSTQHETFPCNLPSP